MASLIKGFEVDIFVSYRQKDNRYDRWVTEFVRNLRKDLEATFKEDISIYFDENAKDGLLETHQVNDSLSTKLKSLIFVPIISQTYCDPKSFAWKNEFLIFKKAASEDGFGLKVTLPDGNVMSRILPVKIHELNSVDKTLLENEVGPLRSIDFIFKSPGVNRPLQPEDPRNENTGHTFYRDQVNKIANAIREVVTGLQDLDKHAKTNPEKTGRKDVPRRATAKKSDLFGAPFQTEEKKSPPGNMTGSIQSVFLEQVHKGLAPNVSFADELAEILNISRDSAYRRIRGETILSLDEAKTLHNRFGISLDVLFSDSSEMVTFHRRVVNDKDYTLEHWAHSIQKNLEFLRTFKQSELIFSARDVPVFHYFRIPELSAFKLFFWMKTLIGQAELEHELFTVESVPKQLRLAAEKLWTTYSSLPSTEIWNEEAVYDTLHQIEFYKECSFFSDPDQPASLCDQLIKLVGQVQAEAASGVKSEGGAFHLYNNEILIADNTVFARMGTRRSVYVNHNSLNLLLTFQEPFCEQTERYLQNLIKKSTLISKTGERERSRFFNKMINRIQTFKERLK